MTTIGIDPGAATGFAVIDEDGAIVEVSTRNFWDCFWFLYRFEKRDHARIVIEQGGENPFTYARNIAANQRAQGKVGMRIGASNREAELLAEGLEKAGFTVVRVQPTRRKKWTAEECQIITGYGGRTSQHGRDALRLAYEYHRQCRLRIKQQPDKERMAG